MRRGPAALLLTALLVCACGPTKLAPTSEGSSTQDTSEGPSETEAGETEFGEEETSGGFLPEPQDLGNDCDPWEQDCPPGEKCVAYASNGSHWDANKCVPVMGDQAPGEPCTYAGMREGTDDCDASGMCWYVEEVEGELLGTCVAFCEGTHDDPECDDGYHCPIASDGALNICLPTCDPVTQNCDDGLGCYWASNSFLCVLTNGNIPVGEPCGYLNDCAPGHLCATAEVFPSCEGATCCAAFCDISLGDGQCEGLPGTACVSFWEAGMAPPNFEHVGVCIVP